MTKEELGHDWVTNNPDGEVRRMYGHYYRAFIAGFDAREKQNAGLTESDLTPKVNGWVSVETGIPENTKVVLCKPVKGTMFVGFYTKGHEIEFQDEDYEGEYDEVEDRNGTLYLKPGWYEEEEQAMSAFDSFYIKREVTHWQPLPSAPLGEVKQ